MKSPASLIGLTNPLHNPRPVDQYASIRRHMRNIRTIQRSLCIQLCTFGWRNT